MLVDNVAPTPQVPRRWFIGEAIRSLAADLLRRRRGPGQAWELFRLNTDPGWLDHLTTDRFLNPTQFAQRYGAVFPGAAFTNLYRARAICWERLHLSRTPDLRKDTSSSCPRSVLDGATCSIGMTLPVVGRV